MRSTAIRQLATSTHPDNFLPIYEEIYSRLENDSLPKFLAQASTNINRPLQLMWYAIGWVDVFIGIIIAILLCTLVLVPPKANRAWRLSAVPFFVVGVCQIYSASRGFCSRVLSRNAVQLRAWELSEFDEEAREYTGKTIYGQAEPKLDTRGSDEALPAKSCEDLGPAADELDYKYHNQHFKVPLSRATSNFRRPPVFGPEKVVEDPRIIETHRQVMRDILKLAFVVTAVFSSIIFSVPGPSA
jgi:hypothetical protein